MYMTKNKNTLYFTSFLLGNDNNVVHKKSSNSENKDDQRYIPRSMKLCKENFYKKLTIKELTIIDCQTPTFSDESFNVNNEKL